MNEKKDENKLIYNSLDDFNETNLSQPFGKIKNEEIEKIRNFHLFKSKNLTNEFIVKNFKRLWAFYSDKIKCESSSNHSCSNPQGIHYDFDIGANGELFTQTYVCPKVQQKLDFNRFKDNYLVCHFNKKMYERLRLDNVYVNFNHHPSRQNLISHLKAIIDGKINHGFYLYGNPGVGKTYIVISACNNLAVLGKTIAYTYVPQIIQELRIRSGTEGVNYRVNLVENLKNADILVLDDLGAETILDARWFYSGFLAPILNYRMECSKLTLFISNYSLSELANKLTADAYHGQPIMDKMSILRIIRRINSLTNNTNFYLDGSRLK